MAISIYLNGTTGAQDGTLEVTGDGIGAELYDIGSVATFFLRAAPNYKTSETVTVYAPLDCEVSSDGMNYDSTCTYAVGAIQDVNVPCYIERIAMTQLPANPQVGTKLHTYPHCEYVSVILTDIVPPVLTGTLTAVAGAKQVALDWTDATDNVGVTGYDIEYGQTTDYGTALTSATSNKTITGLIGGTLYYFRVRAFDANGNKSDWITASATPLAVIDTFRSASLDTTLWSAQVAGNGTITTGAGALINVPAGTDGAILYRRTAIDRAANKTYKWRTKWDSAVNNTAGILCSVEDCVAPWAPASSQVEPSHGLSYNVNTSTSLLARLSMAIANSSGLVGISRGTNTTGGTNRFFNFDTKAWTGAAGNPTLTGDTWYVVKFETNTSSQWRITILNGDETSTVATTNWQDWTAITSFSNSAFLIIGGELYSDVRTAKQVIDWYSEV